MGMTPAGVKRHAKVLLSAKLTCAPQQERRSVLEQLWIEESPAAC